MLSFGVKVFFCILFSVIIAIFLHAGGFTFPGMNEAKSALVIASGLAAASVVIAALTHKT